jgi:hypothetical protein
VSAHIYFAIPEPGIELKREFRQLVLDMGRPSLDALQNLSQLLCLHGEKYNTIAGGCLQARSP